MVPRACHRQGRVLSVRPARRRGPWVAIAGARPNFVKLMPLLAAARDAGQDLGWIHTGQHGARAMSRDLWQDLGLAAPVKVLPATPPGPTRIAGMARRLEPVLEELGPSLVIVLGDVDSTVAGAVAARRLGLPLAHVEAGLRSFEPDLPEEQNRVLVDALADRLHVPEPSGAANLRAEGVARARIRHEGNVMADALEATRGRLAHVRPALPAALRRGPYVLATLHRQANVDDRGALRAWLAALGRVARDLPVVLPVHPRTRKRLGGAARIAVPSGLRLLPPLGYLRFLKTLQDARAVLTDSGGVQVEASLLGVPCVTMRKRTEHLLTLTHGTNVLAGEDPRGLANALETALGTRRLPRRARAWDGRAATRMVAGWARGVAARRLTDAAAALLDSFA